MYTLDSHSQRVTIPEAAYVHTRQSLAESDDTRGCICTICVVDLLMMGGLRSKHVEEFNLNKIPCLIHISSLSAARNMQNINPLNVELNPICHLLALLGGHHILHVSRIRVNVICVNEQEICVSSW
jgi:hypothetical protein